MLPQRWPYEFCARAGVSSGRSVTCDFPASKRVPNLPRHSDITPPEYGDYISSIQSTLVCYHALQSLLISDLTPNCQNPHRCCNGQPISGAIRTRHHSNRRFGGWCSSVIFARCPAASRPTGSSFHCRARAPARTKYADRHCSKVRQGLHAPLS